MGKFWASPFYKYGTFLGRISFCLFTIALFLLIFGSAGAIMTLITDMLNKEEHTIVEQIPIDELPLYNEYGHPLVRYTVLYTPHDAPDGSFLHHHTPPLIKNIRVAGRPDPHCKPPEEGGWCPHYTLGEYSQIAPIRTIEEIMNVAWISQEEAYDALNSSRLVPVAKLGDECNLEHHFEIANLIDRLIKPVFADCPGGCATTCPGDEAYYCDTCEAYYFPDMIVYPDNFTGPLPEGGVLASPDYPDYSPNGDGSPGPWAPRDTSIPLSLEGVKIDNLIIFVPRDFIGPLQEHERREDPPPDLEIIEHEKPAEAEIIEIEPIQPWEKIVPGLTIE